MILRALCARRKSLKNAERKIASYCDEFVSFANENVSTAISNGRLECEMFLRPDFSCYYYACQPLYKALDKFISCGYRVVTNLYKTDCDRISYVNLIWGDDNYYEKSYNVYTMRNNIYRRIVDNVCDSSGKARFNFVYRFSTTDFLIENFFVVSHVSDIDYIVDMINNFSSYFSCTRISDTIIDVIDKRNMECS